MSLNTSILPAIAGAISGHSITEHYVGLLAVLPQEFSPDGEQLAIVTGVAIHNAKKALVDLGKGNYCVFKGLLFTDLGFVAWINSVFVSIYCFRIAANSGRRAA